MLTYPEAKAFYDSLGLKQDGQAYYEDPAIDELMKYADFDQATNVFEYGFGTGRLAKRLFTEKLPASAYYHGVDLSTTMTKITQERLAEFREQSQVMLSDGSPKLDNPNNSAAISSWIRTASCASFIPATTQPTDRPWKNC